VTELVFHQLFDQDSSTDTQMTDQPADTLPFVAPCRPVAATAPLQWLRRGWQDLRAGRRASLAYGLGLAALSYAVAWATWQFGTLGLYAGLASGFVFVGPLLAVGLYSLSRQHDAGAAPDLARSLRDARGPLRDLLILGVVLLVVLLVWARAVAMVHIFAPTDPETTLLDLLPFVAVGIAVGGLFAGVIFAATAFSLPMVLDRDADAITAALSSANAVLRNQPAALLWGIIILALVLVGFATAFLAFVVIFPLLGHATWHAYRATIDASAWPVRES
jgi:uncharacterized membrane protein